MMEIKAHTFRDGISQRRRSLRSLSPDHIAVDERSLADWVRFAQTFTQYLKFFREYDERDPQADGDWSVFFDGDADAIAAALQALDGHHSQNANFSSDILNCLAQPHLALFLTFLQLLEYPQQQFKELTQRRLDFYYQQVLRLAKKTATPDRAHVIFSLAPNQTEHRLAQGIRLKAGIDVQGQDLHYALDTDLSINRAQIASVKTLSVEKGYIDLEAIHRAGNRSNAAFEAMLRWAVGTPNQSDRLPTLSEAVSPEAPTATLMDISHLNALFDRMRQARQTRSSSLTLEQITSDSDQQYILNQLCFAGLTDFYFCFEVHSHEIARQQGNMGIAAPTELEWQQVYNIIERAYRKKINRNRRDRLKKEHRNSTQNTSLSAAFLKLWQFALGRPNPGDPLPPMPDQQSSNSSGNSSGNLKGVANDLNNTDAKRQKTARDYVQHQLFLSLSSFQTIMAMADNTNLNDPQWEKVYQLLEQAQSRKRKFTYPAIGRTETKAVYARNVADAQPDQPLTLQRFHPLIAVGEEQGLVKEQALGIAIAAPVLHLQEGNRQITLTLAFQANSFNRNELAPPLEKGELAFGLHISSETNWIAISDNPSQFSVAIGDFLIPTGKLPKFYAQTDLSLATDGKTVTWTTASETTGSPSAGSSANGFDWNDVDTLLVWPDGKIYRISAILNPRQATVSFVKKIVLLSNSANTNSTNTIQCYSAASLYLNSLQFQISLDATEPAVTAPTKKLSTQDGIFFQAVSDPIVKITLKDDCKLGNDKIAFYQLFKDLRLEKVNIQVAVTDLMGFQLRSDRAAINPKNSFEPFGNQPSPGNSLYFSHPEIVSQKLDSLSLKLEWTGLPSNFVNHYYAYSKCGLSPQTTAIDNTSFQAQLELFINRTWQPIKRQSLFSTKTTGTGNTTKIELLSANTLQYNKSDFAAIPEAGFSKPLETPTSDDLLDQERYFRLELSSPDFQHDLYPLVLNKVARARDDQKIDGTDNLIRDLTVYPPYTPKIKAIAIDYQASTDIQLLPKPNTTTAPSNTSNAGQIFQLHPFGYVELRPDHEQTSDRQTSDRQTTATVENQPTQGRFFLAQYDDAGRLYLGLRDLHPPQSLTLLFQIVSGSGNADLEPPQIQWSYLTEQGWQTFQADQVLADGTNGLLDSGILRLAIPATATNQNPLMPTGLHWLRAIATNNPTAIPAMLDIRAQAVTATLVDHNHHPEHLSQPLAAQSIHSLVDRNPAIAKIEQPYSSFGGRRPETQPAFYTRVSERLRHKQRAITHWDYERLVLEQFPQIYKVKCLTQAEQNLVPGAAQVTVVVIPNLTNTAPFLPLEPKAPQYLLRAIEAYLQTHTSPFVKVVVKNPRYERIKYRVAVRFREKTEQGYYLKQLNQELVRFLSPWAYEEQSDIAFGSSIHSSTVIHFIETRPYVDYVAKLKLIEQTTDSDAIHSRINTTYQINESNLAQVKQADSILVSASEHFIDLITTVDYEEEEFEGINYMIVGVDFIVA
jgi:hypothetical protein